MNELDNKEKVNLKDIILNLQIWFKYFLSKIWILAIVGFIGAVLGFFYAHLQKTIYKASTTFVLETGDSNGSRMGQMAGLAALAGVDLGQSGGDIFQGDNLFELYKSRKMIESVLLLPSKYDSSMLLLDRYFKMNKTKEQWRKVKPELVKIEFSQNNSPELSRAKDSVLQQVVKDINKNNLIVGKNDKKSAIIKIDVKSTDEIFSKEFNEALVAQVNEFYIQTKTKKSLDNITILQRKTDSVRAVMNGSISAAAVILDATPNLNPSRQSQRLIPSQRSQFSAETNKAILGQLVQNLEMSKMNLMKESPLIQVVDEPILPLEIDRIGRMRAMIIGLLMSVFIGVLVLLFQRLFKNIMS